MGANTMAVHLFVGRRRKTNQQTVAPKLIKYICQMKEKVALEVHVKEEEEVSENN